MKPILYKINAFDATKDFIFKYRWSGNQSYGSKLRVYKNSTLALVLENTDTNFKLENKIFANKLVNGTSYVADIASVDSSGVESSFSDKISFTCYSTPVFSFSNIVNGQTVTGSNVVCDITYTQIEGELLNSFKVSLYDLSQTQLSTSGLIYETDSPTYTIGGLSDNTQYYVRAEGTTVHGMSLDTGYILISVDYITPATYATVQLENIKLQGSVQLTCNAISIIGISNPVNATYIDNTKIDLTSDGSYVLYNEGFNISGDFTIELLAQNPILYSTIFSCSDGTYDINIQYCENQFVGDDVVKSYFILTASNAITSYRIASVPMTKLTSQDQVYLLVRRKNNLFDLIATLKV